jgi:formate hydrogenlyase subunit 6/NADH:ubiquinone oxidoreductase subunit I
VNGMSSINTRKCIGCGQCELQCPEECIQLVPHERNVLLPLVKRSEARIPRFASQL